MIELMAMTTSNSMRLKAAARREDIGSIALPPWRFWPSQAWCQIIGHWSRAFRLARTRSPSVVSQDRSLFLLIRFEPAES
jgi:hypothetical protein